jgi:hypothetical protein
VWRGVFWPRLFTVGEDRQACGPRNPSDANASCIKTQSSLDRAQLLEECRDEWSLLDPVSCIDGFCTPLGRHQMLQTMLDSAQIGASNGCQLS